LRSAPHVGPLRDTLISADLRVSVVIAVALDACAGSPSPERARTVGHLADVAALPEDGVGGDVARHGRSAGLVPDVCDRARQLKFHEAGVEQRKAG
jgi:hypothetical protein